MNENNWIFFRNTSVSKLADAKENNIRTPTRSNDIFECLGYIGNGNLIRGTLRYVVLVQVRDTLPSPVHGALGVGLVGALLQVWHIY